MDENLRVFTPRKYSYFLRRSIIYLLLIDLYQRFRLIFMKLKPLTKYQKYRPQASKIRLGQNIVAMTWIWDMSPEYEICHLTMKYVTWLWNIHLTLRCVRKKCPAYRLVKLFLFLLHAEAPCRGGFKGSANTRVGDQKRLFSFEKQFKKLRSHSPS